MIQSSVKFSERQRTLTMSSDILFVVQAVTGQVAQKQTRPTQTRLILKIINTTRPSCVWIYLSNSPLR